MSPPSTGAGRPGIYVRWPRLTTHFQRFLERADELEPPVLDALRRYAETGEKPEIAIPSGDLPAWASLRSELASRAAWCLRRGQIRTIETGNVDSGIAQAVVTAHLANVVNLFLHEGFPRRFPGRTLQMVAFETAAWVALAFAIGCRALAECSAELLIAALRRGYVFDSEHHPIFWFIARLFSGWKRVELPQLPAAATKEQILNQLIDTWHAADPADISALVLHACDHHTHRCRVNNAREFFEFDNGLFIHYPVEILMLYRVREYEGLANPKVDHPLLNTPLGKLPDPMRCEPDELLQMVLVRARDQGFDEEAIIRSVRVN